MKKFLGVLALSAGLALTVPAHAAGVKGKDYSVLSTPQPVSVPADKVEITEFFWYGCPHCFEFEPKLEAWLKKQGGNVVFKRIPVAFRPDFVPHSKMYHALVAMGIEPTLTLKIFNEIHVKKNYLLTPEAQADFLSRNGVDRKKYLEAYNSFSVQSDVQRDAKQMQDYHVDGVPTLFVQGKYETSPAMTNSLDGTLQTLDFLIEQVRAKKM
ncbi:thiol:disulfide interchange protein DsbA/DsbL [Chitinasiproducens palmae]|uniref:thiol:disulfide interchange protein DsbA/DsbL n=1 Tax=Chitinasiproducens palmae TaxID=1770053 RepID=UPI00147D4412|nr:thiol:disulfide interchange protein DsbA/DsbL [Chitinasiproducens palmae]